MNLFDSNNNNNNNNNLPVEHYQQEKTDRGYYDSSSSSSSSSSIKDSAPHHNSNKPGKTVLNLLNPRLLLARRRPSFETVVSRRSTDVMNPGLVPALPEDYDPRIRGNIVHDFSAPRSAAARNSSSPAVIQRRHRAEADRRTSRDTLDKEAASLSMESDDYLNRHRAMPAFMEGFDYDHMDGGGNDDGSNDNTVKHTLDSKMLLLDTGSQNFEEGAVDMLAPLLDANTKDTTEEEEEAQKDDGAVFQQQQQQQQSRQSLHRSSGGPLRFKSNASRFSFDMSGVGGSSAEERRLEEKHKKKQEAARQARLQLGEDVDSEYDDDAGFDSDMLEDDEGLEERIPGVNADADADDDDDDGGDGNDGGFDAPFYAIGGSPDVSSLLNTVSLGEVRPDSDKDKSEAPVTRTEPAVQWDNDKHDDLYYADGEFDDLIADANGDQQFDESVFDDESSHLYDRNTPAGQLATSRLKNGTDRGGGNSEVFFEEERRESLKHAPSVASEFRRRNPNERAPSLGSAYAQGAVLSEHNLEAFHEALERAADEGSTSARFGHSLSTSDQSTEPESVDEINDVIGAPGEGGGGDVATFEKVNDGQEEDDDGGALCDIIAEANAEALENDDEGFYGEEFGFYPQSHQHANIGNKLTNGGYFAPRGLDDGLARSRSGRIKLPGPSLTPITERSEWSTRNSIASFVGLQSHVAGAQFVGMGMAEDDLSLSALLKLRREAWGGGGGGGGSDHGSFSGSSTGDSARSKQFH